MVMSKSNANIVYPRRVILLNDPYTNPVTNLPWVLGQDNIGYQYQIALDALPPGFSIDQIKQNQIWFVENSTTAYRLNLYAGTDTDPITVSGGGIYTTSSGITQLTGEVLAGPGYGSQVAALSTTGVVSGSYGSSNQIPVFTVDSKGRITSATTVTASGSSGGSGITQLTGDVTTASGSGSQAATLQSTTNVNNIISNNSTVTTNTANIALLSGSIYNTKSFNIYDYGTVDPTGIVDSTAAVSGAQAALKANGGGILYFPPGGTYKIQTGIITRVSGSDKRYGIDATDATLKFVGSGVGIDSIYTTDPVSTLDNVMAPVVFRAIDLSLVSAGGIGIRHGNKVGAYYDGRIINGSAGPDTTWPTSGNDGVRGWQFTNISGSAINWTEQTVLGPNSGHHNCYIGCEFNIGNSDTTALSFAYNTFQRYSIETNTPGQRGVIVRGSKGVAAQLYNGNFTFVGNNGNNSGTSQYVGTISGVLTSGTAYTNIPLASGLQPVTFSGAYDGQIVLLKQVTTSGNPQAVMVRGNNPVGSTSLSVYQFTPNVTYSGNSTIEFASVGAVVGWPGITMSGWSSGTAYDASNWRTSSIFWKMEGTGDFSPVWNVPLYVSTSGNFDNFGHLDFDTYSTGIVQNYGTFRIDGRYNNNAIANNPMVVASSLSVSGNTTVQGTFTANNTFYVFPPSGQVGMVIQAASGTINNLFSMKDYNGNTASYIDYNGTWWSTPNPGTTSFRAQYRPDANARILIRNTGSIEFGNGTNTVDTFLQRTASGVLTLSGNLVVTSGININGTLVVPAATGVASGIPSSNYVNLNNRTFIFDDGNTHITSSGYTIWLNTNSSADVVINTQSPSTGGLVVGGRIVSNSGTVTGTNLSGDSGWINASLINGFSTGSVAPAYRLLNNVVYIRGNVTGGSAGSAAFTLPVGYRPATESNFANQIYGTGTFVYITVDTAGNVKPNTGAAWLNSIVFPIN